MIETHQFDLFFSENESSFVITKAKVASRFITEMYHPNTKVIPLNIGFQITDTTSKDVLDMFYRFNNASNKDIFLIYRTPLKRFISGTVEDLLVSIEHNNYNEKFFLKYYLNKHNLNTYKFYNDLETNKESRTFLLEDYYIEFLTNIIEDWFYWQIVIPPINSHHTSPYLAIYDTILKSSNINNNNVKLVNIDDNTINLKDILSPTFNHKIEISSDETLRLTQSNKNFHNFIKSIIDSNTFFNEFVTRVCQIDNDFYNEFEKSNNNIKNEIRN